MAYAVVDQFESSYRRYKSCHERTSKRIESAWWETSAGFEYKAKREAAFYWTDLSDENWSQLATSSERRVGMSFEKGLENSEDTDEELHAGKGPAKLAAENDRNLLIGKERKFTMGRPRLLNNAVMNLMPWKSTAVKIENYLLLPLELPHAVAVLYYHLASNSLLPLGRKLQKESSSREISPSIMNHT